MELTRVVDRLFSDYEGEICNVDRPDDIVLCRKAQAIFNHLTAEYLDFNELGRKYRMNTNCRKVWCVNTGIRADTDRLNPRWEQIVHHRIVRHDCKTFLQDWWPMIITVKNLVVKEYCIYMCSQPFKALLIVRSTAVDVTDRHLRGTWHRLSKEEKTALMTCPTTTEAVEASWRLALTSSHYLR